MFRSGRRQVLIPTCADSRLARTLRSLARDHKAMAFVSKASSSSVSLSEKQIRLLLAETFADKDKVKEALENSAELQPYGDLNVTEAEVVVIVYVSGTTTFNNLNISDNNIANFMLALDVSLARVVEHVPGTSIARAIGIPELRILTLEEIEEQVEIPDSRSLTNLTNVTWLVQHSAVTSRNVGDLEEDLRRQLVDALEDLEGFRAVLIDSGCMHQFGNFTAETVTIDAFNETEKLPTITAEPSQSPTMRHSISPSVVPTASPTSKPSLLPTFSLKPSQAPSLTQSNSPSAGPYISISNLRAKLLAYPQLRTKSGANLEAQHIAVHRAHCVTNIKHRVAVSEADLQSASDAIPRAHIQAYLQDNTVLLQARRLRGVEKVRKEAEQVQVPEEQVQGARC